MFRTLVALGFLAIITVGGSAGLLYYAQSSPATADLDADLAAVRADISDIEQSGVVEGDGAIPRIVQLRLEVLRSTEAMLSQKRTSLLRRIDLHYAVNGVEQVSVDPATLQKITEDLKLATSELQKSELNAQLRGTGGLIGLITLMTVETNRMSVAQLQFSFYNAKYGFVAPFNITPPAPNGPPGTVVDDRNAL